MGAQQHKRHKRSWKNLLLDKGYQLRFTLFMVALSALLMAGLGVWVMTEARKATEVSINSVRGELCPRPAALAGHGDVDVGGISQMAPDRQEPEEAEATELEDLEEAELEEAGLEEAELEEGEIEEGEIEEAEAAEDQPAGGADLQDAEEERVRPEVFLDDSQLRLDGPPAAVVEVPPDYVDEVIKFHQCRMSQKSRIDALRRGERNILYVLLGVGMLLVVGLFVYGIKMTHRVAGPLYKVTMYLDKMKDEVYDEVYDLRRGDQLTHFYDQFKAAHAGLREMQLADIERLRALIEAADEAGLAERSPELKAALADLRQMLKRKEDSLV